MTKQEYFDVIRISRQDFEQIGFDASMLSDSDMQEIADSLSEWLWGDDATQFLQDEAEARKLKKQCSFCGNKGFITDNEGDEYCENPKCEMYK